VRKERKNKKIMFIFYSMDCLVFDANAIFIYIFTRAAAAATQKKIEIIGVGDCLTIIPEYCKSIIKLNGHDS
jgi:PHP family Zn ribbon phosphoesterase